MISQTVEYALRAVVFLANDPKAGRTTEQIAKVTLVPQAYLSKVMQQLAAAGLVRAQRGIGGGFTLLKDPAEITILEIVNAVDPIKRIRTCPLGLAAHGVRLCPLHKRMDEALASVEKAFANSTLAEILAEPTESVPLCAFPTQKAMIAFAKVEGK
jgi:Rrf2 family protein